MTPPDGQPVTAHPSMKLSEAHDLLLEMTDITDVEVLRALAREAYELTGDALMAWPRAEAAAAERERVRVLDQWLNHHPVCPSDITGSCDCGLTAARAAIAEDA